MSANDLVSRLQTEICVLRWQNADLEQQNAELRQLVHALGERVTELQEQLVTAEQRVAELEQAKKELPSFVKANKPKREGPKAPRRPRAKEHNHGRKRAEAALRREEHPINRCPECNGKLRRQRVAWCREVIDLPPPQVVGVCTLTV